MSKKTLKFQPRDFQSREEALELFFCEAFQAYEMQLRTLAFRLLKDNALAKDIVQEVFMDFWESRHKIEEINNTEAFLFRMTRCKIIDTLRKASVDEKLKEYIWHSMKNIVSDDANKIEAAELNEILTSAIQGLPPKRKQIYLLKNNEGKSYREIADEMDISQHTVKNQLTNAVSTIRSFITLKFKDMIHVLLILWIYQSI